MTRTTQNNYNFSKGCKCKCDGSCNGNKYNCKFTRACGGCDHACKCYLNALAKAEHKYMPALGRFA